MSPKGRVIVTCGPAYTPIDEVRRITNHSTGRLGCLLSNRLARAEWKVFCFRGDGATHHEPLDHGVLGVPFSTNDNLLERWQALPEKAGITAVFHAAALTDFTVKEVSGANGILVEEPKIPSRAGLLTITLEPAKKLIGELRSLFPAAKLIGWKYELSGTQVDVLSKGLRQILENRTDACVVNGRAYGNGFGVIQPGKPLVHLDETSGLCDWLVHWLETSA
jgi:phosphopantothenoylcysteine synthetase/decarboxylase